MSWGSEPDSVPERYHAYWLSIKDQLPSAVVELEENFTLHDGRLQSIEVNSEADAVQLRLNGWNRSFSVRTDYVLEFTGSTRFQMSCASDSEDGIELGDLGYCEWEPKQGLVELRMLFASGAIATVQFSRFSFAHTENAAKLPSATRRKRRAGPAPDQR